MISSAEITELPVSEKLLILEAIWQDFQSRYEDSEIPSEHKKVLDQRRYRAETGETQILDWDSVKDSIGK